MYETRTKLKMDTRRILFLTTLVIVLVLDCITAQYVPFNCRRTNNRCIQGSCNTGTGACECSAGYEGPDCGLQTSSKRPNMCLGRECINGGSCYYDGTVHRCYCTAEYYGNRCQMPRVSMECSEGSLFAYVNPFANQGFSGIIYVYNLPRDANCRFSPTTKSGYEGYEIQLPVSGNGQCSSARKQINENGNMAYQYQIFVRYNSLITTNQDERHVFTCAFTLNGTLTATTSTGFNETTFQSLTGTNARRGYQPVTLLVKGNDTHDIIASPVEVGAALYLEFELPANDVTYVGYTVDSCVAYNSDQNTSLILQELAMVSDRCLDSSGITVATGIASEGRFTRVYFEAFKFDDTSLVRFVCRVTLCNANTTDNCNFDYASCPSTNRRRRTTVTQYIKTDIIGQSIQVYDSQAITATVEPQCDMMYFYIVLAVLALFALLTFICAIYLCFKMARRRRKFNSIVIKRKILPDGNVINTVEDVQTGESSSSDRGPIIPN